MFNSKVFMGISVIALAFLCGAVTLQLLEMKDYNLFETIMNGGSSGGGGAAAPVEELKIEIEAPAETAKPAEAPKAENAPAA